MVDHTSIVSRKGLGDEGMAKKGMRSWECRHAGARVMVGLLIGIVLVECLAWAIPRGNPVPTFHDKKAAPSITSPPININGDAVAF